MLSFLPDAAQTADEVLLEVSAVPTLRGYRNPYSVVSAGYSAMAAAPVGGALVFKLDGTARTIVGTAANLYEFSGGVITPRSRGLGYTLGSAKWRFAQFGDTTLAANKSTQLQYSNSGSFADVANAPMAACIETVGPFTVLANCNDTGTGLTTAYGDQSNRWWCSQSFNATGSWQPSVSTRATSGLLVATPGPITGLRRLGGNIVAYKDRSLYLGTLTDDNSTIRWDVVADDVGCATQDAVVAAGSAHYFISDGDIYMFDGTRPQSIGTGIKEWFFSRVNRSYLSVIESLHDRASSNIYWFYPSGSNTTNDSCIVYNYKTQRWGHFSINVLSVLSAVTSSITYDSLGSTLGGITYDAIPAIGYDSPFWTANSPVLAVIGTDYILYSLTGTTGASSFKTGLIGDEQRVSTCTRVRPKFRTFPTSATITHATRMWLGSTPTTYPTASINGDRFDVLAAGRYHQFDLAFTGSMELEAIGPTLVESGAE